jgi:hypothetical protein
MYLRIGFSMSHRARMVAGLLALTMVFVSSAEAQRAPAPPVRVDAEGVLRWTTTNREVALFGVNYAAPFAYDFRAIAAMGVDRKHAIDQDVAHLARLGVEAFRIHVWDKEVSDGDGNLLQNDHLDLFDYLLAQLSARGIKSILTPIAWWGPGYPEPDAPSPGFANAYSKPQMAVDSVALRAQVRYVGQFVAHVNPYTGRSYRDDPNLIAFEIFNEPWHDLSTPPQTTRYINTLVSAMRATGLRKPIFYNISEHFTPAHGAAVCAADIQGVSAQWYPTGLVRGATLPGNPLPNVDRYTLPWAGFPGCRNKAHMVYEFDGADVAMPVMYPAMARAFRGAGFQWATQFAYDPLAIAHTNTEYQTHYLNLVYTPSKAISFLIAGEVFRRVPRGFDAGTYPASERFGEFRTSYADGVSELASDTIFAYSATTTTTPRSPQSLRRVAGVGRSPVVDYDGTGAYFLDRLADGVWRLEVYPDAVPVEDPFSRGNLRRTVTRVYWRTHPMRITLPDLGEAYSATPLNLGNSHQPLLQSGALTVRPGVYLLSRTGVATSGFTADRRIGHRALGEFFAPPPSVGPSVVLVDPPISMTEGSSVDLAVRVAQADAPDSVLAFVRYAGWQGYRRPVSLTRTGPYAFSGAITADTGRTGTLEYMVTVFTGGRAITYPGGVDGTVSRWDFAGAAHWSTYVTSRDANIVLFDAGRDASRVVHPGYVPGARVRSDWVAGSASERTAWLAGTDGFGPTATHVAFRTMLRDDTRSRVQREGRRASDGMTPGAVLRIRARAHNAASVPLEVALTLADGSAWGTTVQVGASWEDVSVPVATLRRIPFVLIPRPYPTFLPYDLVVGASAATLDLGAVDGVQWGFARAPGMTDDAALRVEIESVELQPRGRK